MKKLLLASAFLALSLGTAQAGCSKSAISGTWIYQDGSQGLSILFVNGTAIFGSSTIKIVSLGSNCRGTASITSGMTTLPAIVVAETSAGSSANKPNIVDISVNNMGYTALRFIRD